MITRTEIQWISTDDELPPAGANIVALLPHMNISTKDRSRDWMELRQCRVGRDGYELFNMEGETMVWDTESVMWWAWLPDWMERPGWRKS